MRDAAISAVNRFFDPLYALASRLPEAQEEPEACLSNFMCDCERQGCPGRTVPIQSFIRRIKRAKNWR